MPIPPLATPSGPVGGRARDAGKRTVCVAVLIALGGLSDGCNKKSDAPRPTAIAPSPNAGPPPGPIAMAGGAPGGGVTGPQPTSASGSGSATITGKIVLAAERKANVTPNEVVYLIARRLPDNPGQPNARGSLLAVKRYTASSFPIDFTLGAGDMMFQNGTFEGDLTLAVRVDNDGDPMTRRKGDVYGTVDKVRVGSAGVEIKLDQLQHEDELLAGAPQHGNLPAGHP